MDLNGCRFRIGETMTHYMLVQGNTRRLLLRPKVEEQNVAYTNFHSLETPKMLADLPAWPGS